MTQQSPLLVAFVAPSGTGKTSLLEKVIGRLVESGIRTAAVKHDAHRIELDTEGKDSWRMRTAGSHDTLIVGENQVAWMGTPGEAPSLDSLIGLFARRADVVLVEGFRSAGLPTVLVQRPEVSDPDWQAPDSEQVIAVAHPDDDERIASLIKGLLHH